MDDDSQPAWLSSPPTARRWLGRQMRAYREARGLDVAAVARELRSTQAKVSYTEDGTHSFKPRDLEYLLLPLYEVPEDRWPPLMEACRASRLRGWWQAYDEDVVPEWLRRYIGLEQGADELRSWATVVHDGLLQSEPYMRALMAHRWALAGSEEEVDARVEVRVTRQQALASRRPPLRAHFLLDEAVLHRAVGDPEARAAQAAHMVEEAKRADVTLQVVPFGAGVHPEAPGAFTLLGFGDGDPGVAYADTGRYVEAAPEVFDLRAVWDQLAEMALPPDESIAIITDTGDAR